METDAQIAKSIETSELKEIIVKLREQMDLLSFSKNAAPPPEAFSAVR